MRSSLRLRTRGRLRVIGAPLVFLTMLTSPLSEVVAGVSGAVWTTLADGSVVNGNIYDHKEDAYLNGGPARQCTAAGLPDGDYYFQVTTPSGGTLLSTDDVAERKFRVSGGIVVAYLGFTHVVGTGKCGSVTIQLMPYLDTHNVGGESKVWVTPVEAYDPATATQPNFGFSPSESKTDNFKIEVTD